MDYRGAFTAKWSMAKQTPSTDIRLIANRIIALREALGLNAADFARLVGFSTAALGNYETALRRPQLDQAFKIVRKTGATLDFIYLGDTSGLPHRIASKLSSNDLSEAARA